MRYGYERTLWHGYGDGAEKPPPGWEVDWDHPSAGSLSAYLAMNQGSGGPGDALVGDGVTVTPGAVTPVWSPGATGPALKFGSTGSVVATAIPIGTNYTIAGRFTPDPVAIGSFGAILVRGNNAGVFAGSSGGNATFRIYPASSSSAFPGNVSTLFMATCANGFVSYYVGGVPFGTSSGGPVSMTLDEIGSDTSIERYIGLIEWLAVWNGRVFSAAEARLFSASEYGFLRPPGAGRRAPKAPSLSGAASLMMFM